MTEAGNPPKTKTGGFPASLESAIPPRFPHSHRPGGCYIGFKIQGPKAKPERSLSSAPVPFPFRLILQLEKTVLRHRERSPRAAQRKARATTGGTEDHRVMFALSGDPLGVLYVEDSLPAQCLSYCSIMK